MKLLLQISFFLTFMLALPCLYKGNAQPYYFRHYQVENGLSNNTVNCSIQDKNGFMWFGTKDGLNRFDGYRFKLFTTGGSERSLYPDNIYSLFSDEQGKLWVGSQKGLYWFDPEKEQLVRAIDSITEVWDIQADKTGQLWFISNRNVCRYNFRTKQLKQFPGNSFFYATSACMSFDGTMWFSSGDGFIHKFDTATQTFQAFNAFSHSPKPSSYLIQKIKPAGKGSIYIGTTSQGLKQFDIASGT